LVSENEQKLYDLLEQLDISYKRYEHPPVYTVDEAKQYWQDIEGAHSKNLFLRNVIIKVTVTTWLYWKNQKRLILRNCQLSSLPGN